MIACNPRSTKPKRCCSHPLQLVVIVLTARLAGEIAVRISQSRAVGESSPAWCSGRRVVGLLFPEIFGYVFPLRAPRIHDQSEPDRMILLMFQIGLEFDFSH